MGFELRDLQLAVAGNQPADGGHRVRKTLVTGEVVNVRRFALRNPVLRLPVEPRPDADQLADHRVGIDPAQPRDHAHLRVVGKVQVDA